MDGPDNLLLAFLAIFLLPVGIGALLALWGLRAWLRATAAGASLSIFEVVGLKLRGADVEGIADALAAAEDAGSPTDYVRLLGAQREGIDLRRLAEAWSAAGEKGAVVSFDELVPLARRGELDRFIAELAEAGDEREGSTA